MSWEVAEEEILEAQPPPTSPVLGSQPFPLPHHTKQPFALQHRCNKHIWTRAEQKETLPDLLLCSKFWQNLILCTSVLLLLGWSWRMPEANPSRGWRPIWTHFLAPTPSHRCFLPPHQPIYPPKPLPTPLKNPPPTFLTFRRSGCHCQFVPCRPSPKYAMYAQIFNSSETSPYMRWNSKQTLNMFSSQHEQH